MELEKALEVIAVEGLVEREVIVDSTNKSINNKIKNEINLFLVFCVAWRCWWRRRDCCWLIC